QARADPRTEPRRSQARAQHRERGPQEVIAFFSEPERQRGFPMGPSLALGLGRWFTTRRPLQRKENPMAASSKNGYPKAIPLHPPVEQMTPNGRLTQLNEELAAQANRLKEWKVELEKRASRSRRWTLRLVAACVV